MTDSENRKWLQDAVDRNLSTQEKQINSVANSATEFHFKNAIGHMEALQKNLELRGMLSDAGEIQNIVSKLYSMRRAFYAIQEVREKNGRLF